MDFFKFNGVLEQIKQQYPNLDIKEFLQQKLGLPDYRAEELAARIEKRYFQNALIKTGQMTARTILEKTNKSQIASKSNSYSIDCFSDKEFEFIIKWLFEELGYEVHPEMHPACLGVDLVAVKDDERIAINARMYPRTFNVSESILLIAQETKCNYECQRSIVLITTYFNQQSLAEAQRLNVELWDRDTLISKIDEVRQKAGLKMPTRFPQYQGSLLQSLLKFEETEDFFIEPRTTGKYDLHLQRVKFPLLTFQAHANEVIRCVYRIKNNKPVGEHEGFTLISIDRDNNRIGPNDTDAYTLITQYLAEFLK